jgi:rod shape-determining protein MreC
MFSKRMVLLVAVTLMIAANIIFLTLSGKNSQTPGALGRGVLILVYPFQKQLTETVQSIKDVWNQYFFLVHTESENRKLKAALGKRTETLNSCIETQLENERLRHLLGFEAVYKSPMTAARVVGQDPSSWSKTVIVDKGAHDGIRKAAPVVIPEGIVGVVVEVAPRNSKVLLLIDSNSAVDAMVQRTRARGIVKGGGSDECTFKYVLRKHEIGVGDTVVSSGLDGVFPKGLRIGRISEIVRLNAGIFQKVAVTPTVDFDILEEVFILSKPAQGELFEPS